MDFEAVVDTPARREILLHVCCAPCSAAIIEYLLKQEFKPTLFFFNPNIFPEEEYLKRKNELLRYAKNLELKVVDADYDYSAWRTKVTGLEAEPERGLRCQKCFEIRLLRTAETAASLGLAAFTTSLSSSRWKIFAQILEAGRKAAEAHKVPFWNKDWKKNGLTERRAVLLRENDFYNQQYCGCEFSMRKN